MRCQRQGQTDEYARTTPANTGRNGADRRLRRAAVAAAGRRRGDAEARRRHRGDQERPADPAHRILALHGSAPPADLGAGLRSHRRRQSHCADRRRLCRPAGAERRVEHEDACDRGRYRPAPVGKADRRQHRAGARSLWQRRRHRCAEHRLRRRRLFRRHRRRHRTGQADRTAEPAGRRPDACAPAGARRRRRQGDHRRAPDGRRARRWSARSASLCWARAPR